ncbi:hypothetical protein Tco_0084803 [Tanacetum coccineum]
MNQNYDPNFCYDPIYSGFDQYQPPQFPEIHYPPQATDTELLQARENLMETIQAFLKEYDHIPHEEKCMDLLLAKERFLKIKQAVEEEQNQPEVMQELLLKLMNDLQILKGIQSKQAEQEESAAQSFLLNWNFPMADDDEYTIIYRKPKTIAPDLPIEEPDNSLNMGDEHLNTIPKTEKTSVEDFILSDSNDDGTSSDDDDFEDIEYVSLEEVNDVDQEEKEFDLEDILQIQDVILREKLLNISRLITNIESLNDNPTPDRVLKSPSSVPIPVKNSDSFFEESDTSLSHLDNSLPEFEPFSDDTEETRSGSTTTHANNSFPEYDSFIFEVEPDQGGLTSIDSDNSNDLLLELPEF